MAHEFRYDFVTNMPDGEDINHYRNLADGGAAPPMSPIPRQVAPAAQDPPRRPISWRPQPATSSRLDLEPCRVAPDPPAGRFALPQVRP